MSSTGNPLLSGATGLRICVLVLGMHRSGTSALARTLNLLGCDLPNTLVPEAPGNESGHWESAPICRLNDALLESAGTNWRDFEAVNPDWFRSPRAFEYRARAIAALREEFGDSYLYVLKDPRMCRIAGWWAETIEAAGAEPVIMSIVRHPLEVADSLKKRDNFDPALGELLWLRNTLEAEVQTRGRKRAFVSYDGLLEDWNGALGRAQGALGLAWPKRQGFVTPAVDQFLSEKLRHHRRPKAAGADGAHAWAAEAFSILDQWTRHGEAVRDYAVLDAIRARLDEAGHAFARLVALQWYHQGQAAKFQQLSAVAEQNSADLGKKLVEAESRSRQAVGEAADVKARLAQTESALKQRSAEADETARDLAGLKAAAAAGKASHDRALSDARAEAERRLAELQAAQKEVSRLSGVLAAANAEASAEIGALKSARTGAEAALVVALQRAEILDKEKARLQSDLAARFSEIAVLSTMLRTRDGEAESARAELAARETAVVESQHSEAARIEHALKALAAAPFLPAFRGRQWRRRAALLKATGLFDADWYLSRYADIAETGVDPALHFLKFGLKEGRHPSHLIARARGEA